jgi:hypothetical protein
VELAYDMARRDLLGRIQRDLDHFHGRGPEITAPEPMNEATGAARHAG